MTMLGTALLLSACGQTAVTDALEGGVSKPLNALATGEWETLSENRRGPCKLYDSITFLKLMEGFTTGDRQYILNDVEKALYGDAWVKSHPLVNHTWNERLGHCEIYYVRARMPELERLYRSDRYAYNRRIQQIANELRG